MIKILQRSAANAGHPIGAGLLERVSWDDLRLFVVVARTLSFRKTATVMRTSSSTVVRRVERLERTLGFRLFDRLPDGVGLTAEGRSVHSAAQEMERASRKLRTYLDQDITTRGVVRCAITEGLGTFWVLPHLVEFNRANPYTVVDLRSSMEWANVLRMEADVAIQLTKPDRPDLKAARLGRLHIYPFASRSYVETYGVPADVSEVVKHRIVDQTAPQIDEGVLTRLLKLPSVEGIVAVRTNSSVAHFYAVELGAGIGGLPTYAAALGADVIPIDIGLRHETDIWMTYHPDARSIRRVSVFIDWLRSLFDPRKYPWFRDEFIHPRDLAANETPETPARVDMAHNPPVATRPRKAKIG
ncbi:MAG TPA: LysR family transcriptional regulator [Xanthobacteraceae bacterium]|nr:LysR family transcriptional regulator [Xanthobacteraceae bacterium]